MKKLKNILLTLGLATATPLFLAGCAEGDHAGHDHDDHAHEAEASVESGQMMAVVENPTEAQLAGTKAYPLETCLVSGEALGSMGDPLVLLVGDQQVKLCCEHCLPDMKKDTAKLMTKLAPSAE